MQGAAIVQLERERKIITDTFKMVAYRAETQLANLVGPLLPSRDDEARKFMRQVFELPADLLPDHEQGTLVVRMHSMTTPRDNHVLATLCGVLNAGSVLPGTDWCCRLRSRRQSRDNSWHMSGALKLGYGVSLLGQQLQLGDVRAPDGRGNPQHKDPKSRNPKGTAAERAALG